jgi:glucose/arabinose dehydrogenase
MKRLLCVPLLLLLIAGPAAAQTTLRADEYVAGFSTPVAFVADPTNASVFFVVEQGGRIRVVRDRVVQAEDFLNLTDVVLSGGERGLLGLAFAPDYATSRRFFVNYTAQPSGHTVIARFRRSADNPLRADRGSEFRLRWSPTGLTFIEQPFANHNGGHIAFGPDGYLYIGMGDGGSGNDPQNHAQRADSLLGKFLRIDINVADGHLGGYEIPPTNPARTGQFPIGGVLPEIWSFGVRNPWRWNFDDPRFGGTGAMVIGDVGQGRVEEVSYEPAGRGGRNYGWRNFEGTLSNVTSSPPAYTPLVGPIHEYGRSSGASITGGYVYRGRSLGSFYRGRYFFADFISGRVWSIALTIGGNGEATSSDLREHTAELGGNAMLGNVSAFGVDLEGELFIVNYSGRIVRVRGVPSAPTNLRIIR